MFVLQELWRGNITPSERFVRSGSEYKKIAGKLSDEMDRLMEMISPEAKVRTPPGKCMLTAGRCACVPAELCTHSA